jgi:hypothetical protein
VPAPQVFVQHLAAHNYHPRSSKHGDSLCEAILNDLLAQCPAIAGDANAGRLVYQFKRKVTINNTDWNIDLVLGPPPAGFVPQPGVPIVQTPPATIRIAIEAKTIMTEHGKAQRNRFRDLSAFHQHIHDYDFQTVAGAITAVNMAATFLSPLRGRGICPHCGLAIAGLVTTHKNPTALATRSVNLLRGLPVRSQTNVPGLEANCVIVVTHDNQNGANTALQTALPAPPVGDPIHYDSFIRRICDRYTQRWPANTP